MLLERPPCLFEVYFLSQLLARSWVLGAVLKTIVLENSSLKLPSNASEYAFTLGCLAIKQVMSLFLHLSSRARFTYFGSFHRGWTSGMDRYLSDLPEWAPHLCLCDHWRQGCLHAVGSLLILLLQHTNIMKEWIQLDPVCKFTEFSCNLKACLYWSTRARLHIL